MLGANMLQSTETSAVVEPSMSGVSWPAVTAGAVAACAVTLLLIAFGTGLGMTVVSPWSGSGVSATTFKIGTGLYFVVMAMMSSAIGGYLAGRLRTKWTGVHSDEVYFRDTAHGFLAWAFASVLGAAVLATPATAVLGGVSTGASHGAANAAPVSNPADPYVDLLLRTDNQATQTPNPADTHAEQGRIFAPGVRNGSEISSNDRAYVAKVVATRTGLSQQDAEKRVADVTAQAKADLDKARKATAQLSFWLAASLLIGAFSASLAATEGGGLRDGTWGRTRIRS